MTPERIAALRHLPHIALTGSLQTQAEARRAIAAVLPELLDRIESEPRVCHSCGALVRKEKP